MTYLTPGDPSKRLKQVIAAIMILVVIFAIRLIDLQIIQADAINAKSYEKRAVTRTVPALRGEILDVNGKVLAKTILRYDINVAPSKVGPVSRQVSGQTVSIPIDSGATFATEVYIKFINGGGSAADTVTIVYDTDTIS